VKRPTHILRPGVPAVVLALAIVLTLAGPADARTTRAAAAPTNTSPPTISGTPQQGARLTGTDGSWSGAPTDYNLFWVRCDNTGASCSNIGGANHHGYTVTSADVGQTLRFKVGAANASGRTFVSSVPTAVITAAAAPAPAPAPAPATGCPAGAGTIQIANLSSPALLLLDGQQASPAVIHHGDGQVILRYHVSACGGRPVQGALVYGTAVPFSQFSVPPEATTGADGWAELDFTALTGFPVSANQGLLAIFVRARKSGEDLLGGVSTRRLFSVPVNLHG
jgi:hypothetical protein